MLEGYRGELVCPPRLDLWPVGRFLLAFLFLFFLLAFSGLLNLLDDPGNGLEQALSAAATTSSWLPTRRRWQRSMESPIGTDARDAKTTAER